MSTNLQSNSGASGTMPEGHELQQLIDQRRRRGTFWAALFQLSMLLSIVALTALLYNVINHAFGLVATQSAVDVAKVIPDGRTPEALSKDELIALLQANVSKGLMRRFENDQPFAERSRESVYALVQERVFKAEVMGTWSLFDSLFRRKSIEQAVATQYPGAKLTFRSWVRPSFITSAQASVADLAGVRSAILGSLWTILITILFALPIGVGAAIYLEEYAREMICEEEAHVSEIEKMMRSQPKS